MKQPLLLLLIAASPLWAVVSCSNGPEAIPPTETVVPTVSQTAEDVESIIMQLERDWVDAIVNNDTAAVDRILADDFVGTSPAAISYFKEAALQDLESGIYVVESMDLDEVSANVYGNTAVAFTSQQEESSYSGEDTSGHYHYTNVWIRSNGQWQVVASHGSRSEQPH